MRVKNYFGQLLTERDGPRAWSNGKSKGKKPPSVILQGRLTLWEQEGGHAFPSILIEGNDFGACVEEIYDYANSKDSPARGVTT